MKQYQQLALFMQCLIVLVTLMAIKFLNRIKWVLRFKNMDSLIRFSKLKDPMILPKPKRVFLRTYFQKRKEKNFSLIIYET